MNTKKFLQGFICLSIMVGGVVGLAYLSDGFTNWDLLHKFKAVSYQHTLFEADGIEYDNNSLIGLPQNIIVKQTLEEQNLDEKAKINLNASGDSDYISNKKIIWNVKWKDESNKKISDYVTLNIDSNTFKATLVVNKGFSNKILITASSQNGISNTCTVDYLMRYESIANNKVNKTNNYYIFDDESMVINTVKEFINNISINKTGTTGSVNHTIKLVGVYNEADFTLYELLKIKSETDFTKFISDYKGEMFSDYLINYLFKYNEDLMQEDKSTYLNDKLNKSYYSNLEEYFEENIGNLVFNFEIEITNEDNSIVIEQASLTLKYRSLYVDNITLSKDNIVF